MIEIAGSNPAQGFYFYFALYIQMTKMTLFVDLYFFESWDIANGSNGANNDNGESITATVDNKTRLQALALVNDYYKYIMDLCFCARRPSTSLISITMLGYFCISNSRC